MKMDNKHFSVENNCVTCEHYLGLVHVCTPWLYGPLRTSASFTTDAHSYPLVAFYLHLVTFCSGKIFSTSSSHPNLGLPFMTFP
jgi:hypothetical protein